MTEKLSRQRLSRDPVDNWGSWRQQKSDHNYYANRNPLIQISSLCIPAELKPDKHKSDQTNNFCGWKIHRMVCVYPLWLGQEESPVHSPLLMETCKSTNSCSSPRTSKLWKLYFSIIRYHPVEKVGELDHSSRILAEISRKAQEHRGEISSFNLSETFSYSHRQVDRQEHTGMCPPSPCSCAAMCMHTQLWSYSESSLEFEMGWPSCTVRRVSPLVAANSGRREEKNDTGIWKQHSASQ